MKSIKPGRGPSLMSGIACVFSALFGVVWTFVAASMGGGFIALFGVIFIVMAIVNAVYNFRNATGKNRYSEYDITEHWEESDPLNERFEDSHNRVSNTGNTETSVSSANQKSRFCPYCGTKAEEDYAYCNRCGKKLP